MTNEDILRMAKEVGFAEGHGTDDVEFLKMLERFASLIESRTIERCAKKCEVYWSGDGPRSRYVVRRCAAAIREMKNE